MKVDPLDGLPSRTHFTVLGRAAGRTLLALAPLTGRTHQLRVHCAAMGWPILGDPIYGPPAPVERLHLLARAISVPLAKTKPPILVEAPVPWHMRDALARFAPPREDVPQKAWPEEAWPKTPNRR